MASVWGELKRRNVVKVAVAYAIVGWLLIEIASTVLPTFEAPQWVLQTITFLVILGFPLALILSWAYELTPDGMERTKAVPASESITQVTGQKLNYVIIGVLVLAVGIMFVDNYLPESGPFAGAEIDPASLGPRLDEPAPSQPIVVEEQREALPNSVAVLLCDNLSLDPEDAFVAESIHTEIINQLVKIRALTPIARTTVLKYADAPHTLSQIAEELNVETVMECGVRYAGDAIVVDVQLIDPDTNLPLWGQSYPGDLSDLSMFFAMQTDIAMNIANALQAQFTDVERKSIEQIPTSSPAAYALYLRALSTGQFNVQNTSALPSALSYVDRATALDPQFALAYAYKALLLANRGRGRPELAGWEAIAEEAALLARGIDPNLAWAHSALGSLYHANWREREAQREFELANQLSPNDTHVLAAYAYFKWDTGQYEAALPIALRLVEVDPRGTESPNYLIGLIQFHAHNYEAAETSFLKAKELNPGSANAEMHLARIEVARGNHLEGIRRLRTAEQLFEGRNFPAGWLALMAEAYALAGRPDDTTRLLNELERRDQVAPIDNADRAIAALATREYGEAKRWLQAAIEGRELTPGLLQAVKANLYQDPVLEEPEWRELRDRIHSLD